MDYEYEYGRYKDKVQRQQKEIRELKETIESFKSVIEANNAMIFGVVKAAGREVKVYRKDINAALRGDFAVELMRNDEDMSYTLRVKEENNAEEELRKCENEVSVPGEAAAEI